MSTRSNIGMVCSDGSVLSVYCHFDGYPDGVGSVLSECYSEQGKVEELLSYGNLSSLGRRLYPEADEEHTFDKPVRGVCVFYHRDRGEEKEKNVGFKFENESEYFLKFRNSWSEFAYLWKDNKWYICPIYNDCFGDGLSREEIDKDTHVFLLDDVLSSTKS